MDISPLPFEFTRSTGLQPYVNALGGEDASDGKKFLTEYNRLLVDAYPEYTSLKDDSKKVVLLSYKRFFMLCKMRI